MSLRRNEIALSARHVTRVHGAATALDDVSLDLIAGQLTVVTGASGAGKSTLLRVLGGYERPDAGTVWIGDRETPTLTERELRRLRRERIAYVPQAGSPRGREGRRRLDGLLRRGDPRQAVSPLEAVAGAVATGAPVILADEPAGDLGSVDGRTVLAQLRECADAGRTVVLVAHDPATGALADRVVCLAGGTVCCDLEGPGEEEINEALGAVAR